MAINQEIISTSWEGQQKSYIEAGLKTLLQRMLEVLESPLAANSVGSNQLTQELRDVINSIGSKVPNTRTVNNKELSSNITIGPDDIMVGNQTLADKLDDMDDAIGQGGDTSGLAPRIAALEQALDDLTGTEDTTQIIDTFNEVIDFLANVNNDETLLGKLQQLQSQINSKANDNAVVKSISVNGTAQAKDGNGNVNIQMQTGSTISPATAAPSMDGTANVGSSAKYAREDHVHPHDTSKQDALTFDDAPTAGSNNPVKSGGVKQAIDNKLTEVVVNEMSGAADIITIDDADLAFIDEDGNIAMKVAEGHVETANFDSRQVATNTTAIQQLQSQIGQQGSVQTDVVVKEDADAAFDIADESGRVALRITSKGHIKTKGFDSENMDIFRATKLDSPQCVCHGYGSSTGQANTLAYFRNGIAKGYKFFEVDGVDCRDGVTVCTHSYSTYSVKNKSTGETESIVFSEIDSTDLLTNYTWPNDEPIAMLKDVIWLICYFHRCPLHIDGQGMTKTSRYAASQYAESLGVGQYVFHELSSGIYNDWDIPCNAIVDCGNNIGNQIAANKKSNNNIIFYFASNFFQSEEHLQALADTIHAGGCYLMSWTFSNIDTIRTWFKCGADFLITAGIVNSQV